ncbi:MAG: hypothetical protein ACE5PT_15100, partial [Gemmatimonadales bacterium]
MKPKWKPHCRGAAVFAFALMPSAVQALTVGFVRFGERGSTAAQSAIEAAGHTAVALDSIAAADLEELDVLWVLNPSNLSHPPDLVANLSRVADFVAGGG